MDTDLVRRVQRDSPSNDPLDELSTAITLASIWHSDADQTVDHFVARARGAGRSWTDIGQRFGVSKQAARERFGDRFGEPDGPAFTPKLQQRLIDAAELARHAGSPAIENAHVLLALRTGDGVAHHVLEKLHVKPDRLREVVTTHTPHSERSGDRLPPESAELLEALGRATQVAREYGHNYVGTEHVLFVLATEPGSTTQRILGVLGVDVADLKRELATCIEGIADGRKLPRRRRRTARRCSFCGRTGRRLVAGPGVWICADCARLALELTDR